MKEGEQTLKAGLVAVVMATCAACATGSEQKIWDSARNQNTETAYRTYLAAYPSGEFADAANRGLDRLNEKDILNQKYLNELAVKNADHLRTIDEMAIVGEMTLARLFRSVSTDVKAGEISFLGGKITDNSGYAVIGHIQNPSLEAAIEERTRTSPDDYLSFVAGESKKNYHILSIGGSLNIDVPVMGNHVLLRAFKFQDGVLTQVQNLEND